MSMATAIIKPTREADGDQCVEFPDIGWKGYVTLLRLRGERSMPKMVYLDGTVWLMSPSFPHERLKKRLGWVVEEIVVGFDIPCIATALDDLPPPGQEGGVEGDQTYYLANEARIRGKDKIRLRTDPPPDLAIEAVYSHDAEGCRGLSPVTRPGGLDLRRVRAGHPGPPAQWQVCPVDRPVQPSRSSRRPRCMIGSVGPRTMSDTEWIERTSPLGPADAQAARSGGSRGMPVED